MAQLAAELLGVPLERVTFQYGDTTLAEAPINAGSMTVASVGSAVHGAVMALKDKIVALVASDPSSPLQGASGDRLKATKGRLALTEDPSRGETYAAILSRHSMDKLEAQFDAKPDPDEAHSAHAFGAHFAEVAVDPHLGLVRMRRIVSALAAGRILNARTSRSQCIGGIVQGAGMASLEHTHLDRRFGTYTSVNLGEYLVPVNADIRSIDVILVEEDGPHVNPIGAKGIGELPFVGVAGALANAVYHATGKRVRNLPITVEKLL
jgi:xanthine dehydrogenase YagR molybdenum-binding subunit